MPSTIRSAGPGGICRFGILGTASIARKNWRAIRLADNCRLVAVASRSLDRAAAFVAECQADVPHESAPDPVGSYEALLARDDVDAVYLPLPTAIRGDWAVRAAHAGKHVLTEKPAGTSVADVERIVAACAAAGVQFMDGVMFLHSGRLERIRAALDAADGVGAIRRIVAEFTFRAADDFFAGNIRTQGHLEPLGCLGDLGVYPVCFALWALWPRLPTAVTGRMLRGVPGVPGGPPVPVEFAGELLFREAPDASASFFCSFLTELQQWAHVGGDRGSLRVDDFVLPYHGDETAFTLLRPEFVVRGCDFSMQRREERIAVAEHGHGHATAQEAAMFREFGRLALGRVPDDRWPRLTLAVQRVMMACLESARLDGREVALGG